METTKQVKKNIWYGVNMTPPRRTERLGGLQLLLWLDEKPQPGYYSHEENQFYVLCHKYAPKTKNRLAIETSIEGINQALSWEPLPTSEAKAWMLIDKPSLPIGE